MKASYPLFFRLLILLALLVGGIWLWPYLSIVEVIGGSTSFTEQIIAHKLQREKEGWENLHFDLKDPEEAPKAIRQAVQLGYRIMLDTPRYADQYAGDKLSCTNCHFAGGNTTGGSHNGISLAGVAATYPKYNPRAGIVIDLPTRINACFQRSMNGKALPLDSPEMQALLVYLNWISQGLPHQAKVPWLGLQTIQNTHIPNPINGQQIYFAQCAPCHGINGNGEVHDAIPPIWGPLAYNDGAGMHNEEVLASFIYENMPYNEPNLSEEDAMDVAAWIAQQPRPLFNKREGL